MATPAIDHVQTALARLLYQFQGAHQPNMRGIAAAFAAQLNEVEAALGAIEALSVDTETGAPLVGDAAVVGLTRDGRTDDELRAAVRAQSVINQAHARGEDVIFALASAIAATSGEIELTEPAAGYAVIDILRALTAADGDPERLADVLDAAVGGGIAHALIWAYFDADACFTMATGDALEVSSVLGFGDDTETTGGYLADVSQ